MKSDDAVGSSDINLLRKDVDASPVKFNFKTFRADVDMVRTMCGSRTGGWSLPCVMSD
jgi:hypothetical protein